MSGRIPREFIDNLLLRVDIVDLIDSYVPLKKSGANHVARCPFHIEKTPSFTVNANKQFFYCFGCGASGNAIGFLMDYAHLGFVEAVEDLASFVGLEVPKEAHNDSAATKIRAQDLTEIYTLLQSVAGHYVQQLRNHRDAQKAVAYLKARGVSGEQARDFQLGYAPEDRRGLIKQFPERLLLEAGLLVKKEDGNVFDRFRGRVMFPIRDRRGRVIGFGGRVLGDALPKYMNSPETAVFHKGREVYGLFELLAKNAKPERILVVEGYMDVIALNQYGVDYVVATLGTATSKAHVDLLFRFTAELIFCFDGDAAGRKAAWRAVEISMACLRDGRQVRIMLLPQGSDPDSLVREQGAEMFCRNIASAQQLSDYFFGHLSEGLDLASLEARAKLVQLARPSLEKLPNGIFRDLMLARLQELAHLQDLDIQENQAKLKLRQQKARIGEQRLSAMRTAVALLLQYPELSRVAQQKAINWQEMEMPGGSLLRGILQRIDENPDVTLPGLIEGFRGLPEERYVKLLAQQSFMLAEYDIEKEFSGALEQLLFQARELKLTKLILKAKEQGLSAQERELLAEMLANSK